MKFKKSKPVPQPQKLSPRDQGKVRENRFELTNTKADVIFAFYGYGESWAGEAGLPAFKQNVEAFIKHSVAGSRTIIANSAFVARPA